MIYNTRKINYGINMQQRRIKKSAVNEPMPNIDYYNKRNFKVPERHYITQK